MLSTRSSLLEELEEEGTGVVDKMVVVVRLPMVTLEPDDGDAAGEEGEEEEGAGVVVKVSFALAARHSAVVCVKTSAQLMLERLLPGVIPNERPTITPMIARMSRRTRHMISLSVASLRPMSRICFVAFFRFPWTLSTSAFVCLICSVWPLRLIFVSVPIFSISSTSFPVRKRAFAVFCCTFFPSSMISFPLDVSSMIGFLTAPFMSSLFATMFLVDSTC
mmetsp:Transcript_10242/g.23381  ORF Transcript_10242/g.23381 Transcript_10242/m.23381 type:complete len:220 (-) Transcript_10242:630-1289(-)